MNDFIYFLLKSLVYLLQGRIATLLIDRSFRIYISEYDRHLHHHCVAINKMRNRLAIVHTKNNVENLLFIIMKNVDDDRKSPQQQQHEENISLPPGWTKQYSKSQKRVYYYHV